MMFKAQNWAVGFVRDGVFLKFIWAKNVLRLPEPSFTVDRNHYNELRPQFTIVHFMIRDFTEVYEISAADFDKYRVPYDYGAGWNYRVAITHFKKVSAQSKMRLEE